MLKPCSINWNIVNLACRTAEKGELADSKKKYAKALDYYERSEGYFIHALKYEAVSDEAKNIINDRYKEYQKRMEEIRSLLGVQPSNKNTYR